MKRNRIPKPPTEWIDFIAPDGLVYSFEDGSLHHLLTFSGWGEAQIEYVTTRVRDGERVDTYSLRPRTITINYRRQQGCSRLGYWLARSEGINAIRPNRSEIRGVGGELELTRKDGTRRRAKVLYRDGFNFAPRSLDVWDEWGFTETVTFRADDPVLYDPEPTTLDFTLASLTNIVFPITFPIIFGGSVINDIEIVSYVGTWESFPIITLTGPLLSPKILNSTTNTLLALTYNLVAGEIVTIDTTAGVKSVTSSINGNIIGTLTDDSDLAEFSIVPSPIAPNGLNTIQVKGGGALVGSTAISIEFFTRFIGI